MDHAIINLMRDYFRKIDSNYIEAATCYFKKNFTLVDLLARDVTNKMFARTTHIKMNSGNTQFSAKVAANYLINKLEEEAVVIYLENDDSEI